MAKQPSASSGVKSHPVSICYQGCQGNSFFNPIVLGDDSDEGDMTAAERKRLKFHEEMEERAAQGLCTWDAEKCIEGPPEGNTEDNINTEGNINTEDNTDNTEGNDGAPPLVHFDLAFEPFPLDDTTFAFDPLGVEFVFAMDE